LADILQRVRSHLPGEHVKDRCVAFDRAIIPMLIEPLPRLCQDHVDHESLALTRRRRSLLTWIGQQPGYGRRQEA
jgi:hypothetical protein